jgi:cytosine/adenosine deaminase-related metal-dependent hydrolase
VLTSFNSDSDELARRLNMEAAKAVKYGGVPPQDALAFVTSNPARQLGIADKVGSLEPGKDGDFVVWSGDPLATSSIALETWIEGAKYFDRADDLARRASVEKERADLVAKAKKSLERPAASAPAAAPTPAPQAGGGR